MTVTVTAIEDVIATVRRQATTVDDFAIALDPAGSRGTYEVELPALAPGEWDVEIEARGSGDAVFRATKAVTVQ